MSSLNLLAQLDGSAPQGWWWSTVTSRPAVMLLLFGLGCVLVLCYLGWRMTRLSPQTRPTLRERFADDSGVAMMEFVLVTPVLLFVTLLLLQTALVFTGLFYVQYSAYTGARSAIVQIPTDSTESINQIMVSEGSEKYDAILSSAVLAVVPVSGSENGSSVAAAEIVAGVSNAYSAQGQSEPAWIDNLLSERLYYAMNHTQVTLERVTPGNNAQDVEFEQVEGFATFSPKEAIAVRVRHEFALSVPLASRVFALVGESGTYSPATRSSDSPMPPGQWTKIEARAILTNEGIDRRLPEAPTVPRR